MNRLLAVTNLTRKEIQKLVDDKGNEFKGLISELGVLLFIAIELGLKLKGRDIIFVNFI